MICHCTTVTYVTSILAAHSIVKIVLLKLSHKAQTTIQPFLRTVLKDGFPVIILWDNLTIELYEFASCEREQK